MTKEPVQLRARLVAELQKTFLVFVYLAIFLGSFSIYRRLLLAEYQISYLHYGYTVVEALVLSKVIVFGSVLRLGERFKDWPLIVPTLYKTFCFSILVLVFSVVERLISGWVHGKTTQTILDEATAQGTWEILIHALVVSGALLPLFAIWETARVLGDHKLYVLFFARGREGGASPSPGVVAAPAGQHAPQA